MPKPAASNFPVLWLNATERERVELAIITPKATVIIQRDARAQALVGLINELLEKAQLDLAAVNTIAVSNRPGSLTGTRIGVTVANTLGWLQKLPLIELDADSLAAAARYLRRGQIATKPVAAVQDEVVY
ncbi:MAG TPA: hypothetical protein VLE93_03300 [Candidatus Saccharimonadales bacterium]|nr:hypothetical protein [Candidatus Saccharimonadales bacterium]